MPKNNRLLASAPSLEMIGDGIARFYCGERKDIVPNDDGSWSVASPKTGKVFDDVRIILKKGRYRFEMV